MNSDTPIACPFCAIPSDRVLVSNDSGRCGRLSVLNIAAVDDALVLHFETENNRINAYTLASALVSIADAAKAANASLNPGFDIEVVVEATGPGSFRAKLRAIYATARNLFSDQRVTAIILGVISSFIYERTLAVNTPITVEVRTDEVVIVRGQDRVIIPRQVYENSNRRTEQQLRWCEWPYA